MTSVGIVWWFVVRRARGARLGLALLFALLFSSAQPVPSNLADAQTTSASVSGTIVDRQGGVIPDVVVVITNTDTNDNYSTKTNHAGVYSFPTLKPGNYQILVTKQGFKQINLRDIALNVQDSVDRNFTLDVGGVSETIVVNLGDSININTTDASVSTVVDQSYVKNMPLNGRSFQDLILLTPGVVTETPQGGESGEFSVNGQRTHSNYYTVDGVSANTGTAAGQFTAFGGAGSGSVAAATALGTTQALVSVDALQEFRVQSSTYSAEYGRNPGGQFAFETKSGTNQWHGTAFDYLRNGFFDAQDWFNNYFGKPSPGVRQNDFGGTFGGPILKNKAFFFLSYEGLRLTVPQPATPSFVPDAALRASAPTAVQQALNAFPVQSPNGIDDKANGIAQFIGTWSNPNSVDSTSARLDHVINDKVRLFFRFGNTTSSSASRGSVPNSPSVVTSSDYTARTYTGGITSVFSNHLSNEARLNYTSNETTQHSVGDDLGGATPVNLARLSGLGGGSFPFVELAYGGYLTEVSQSLHAGAQKQWNVVDTVGFSFGRHQFKLGLDYRRLAPLAAESTPLFGYIYLSQSGVMANDPLVLVIPFTPAHALFRNFSAFAQDQWNVSHRVSLSMGLRWEVNPPPGVTQGLMPYTVQGTSPDSWTLAPQGTPLWKTTWFNFAPRLGVAYTPHDVPGRETVVRGGVGLFFDTGQQLGSLGFNGPGFSAENVFFAPFPVANGPSQVPAIVNPPCGSAQRVPPCTSTTPAYGFATHLQLPYTLQWNVSIQQALGNSQSLTVSYVGSHAARLLENIEYRPASNPNLTDVFFVTNGLTSYYGALQTQYQRRLNRGLTALASYTWSHCIDYGSGNYYLGYQRGNCNFDVRHNVSTAFSYDLPNLGRSSVLKAILDHWGIDDRFSARSSFPVTLYGNQLLQTNGQFFFAGLNIVPGQPIYLYGGNCASVLQGLGDLNPGQGCPGGRAINPNAFTAPASGIGNAPRNFARGFAAWQMDFAVRREFPIQERVKLQFRAEAFNIFNHPNFGTVNDQFGQSTFGQATGTLANSILGIVNPLYRMGGPRSMQFALRVLF